MAISDWDGIEIFVAINDCGSLSAAAQKLRISTSQVSRSLAALETRLGARLLHRSTRTLSLTNTGATFLDHCRVLVRNRDDAFAAVGAENEGFRGRIRMTCSVGYGELVLSRLVMRFAKLHPQLGLELELTNDMRDIVGTGWDLAVRTGDLRDNRLVASRIADRQLYLCASPEYCERYGEPTSIKDLADHRCIAAHHQWKFSVGGGTVRLSPRSANVMFDRSGRLLLDAALEGIGIVQLPEIYVAEYVNRGSLKILLSNFSPEPDGIWAVYPGRDHVPSSVRALVQFLRENFTLPAVMAGELRSSEVGDTTKVSS